MVPGSKDARCFANKIDFGYGELIETTRGREREGSKCRGRGKNVSEERKTKVGELEREGEVDAMGGRYNQGGSDKQCGGLARESRQVLLGERRCQISSRLHTFEAVKNSVLSAPTIRRGR